MKSRLGEISILFLVAGIITSSLALYITSALIGDPTSQTTSAQSFPYKSILEIRNEAGEVIPWESGMRWSNGLNDSTKSEGDVKDPGSTVARLSWNPGIVQENLQNVFADVVVKLPSHYQVLSAFCESSPASLCENTSVSSDKLTRRRIQIVKDGVVTYGLTVKDLTPQSGFGDLEVQVVALNYPQKTDLFPSNHISNQVPTSCSRITSGQQRPLYLYSVEVRATCVSGSCKQGESYEQDVLKRVGYARFNHIPAGSYKVDIKSDIQQRGFSVWEGCNNSLFTVASDKTNSDAVIILVNKDNGEYAIMGSESICRERTGKANIIQDIEHIVCYFPDGQQEPQNIPEPNPPAPNPPAPNPPADPPSRPGPGGSCGNVCTYSEVVGGNTQCHEGNCPQGEQNCGLNTNCSYVSGCSTGTRVTCPGNGNPPPNPPAPNPPAPNPPSVPGEPCKHLEGNGPYRIVIIPDDFTDLSSFESYARAAVTNVRNSKLEDVYDKLTFIMSTDLSKDYSCGVNNSGLTCSGYEKPKSDCKASPGSAIVIWNNDFNEYAQSAAGVAVLPLPRVSISTAHELGHSIARLYDEYVYENQDNTPYGGLPEQGRVNCAPPTDTSCTKWDDTHNNDVGCFKGCSRNSWHRPIERYSMMGLPENRVGSGAHWHRIHLNEWRSRVSAAIGFAPTYLDEAEYHVTTHIVLSQNSVDNLSVKSIQNENSYPLTTSENGPSGYYVISLLDESKNVLFSKNEDKYVVLLEEGPTLGDLRSEILLYLPYLKEAQYLSVQNDDGKEILLESLDRYSRTFSKDSSSLCGNSFCDSSVGENENSCSVDCGSHLAKSEQQRSDLNSDGIVSTVDLALLSSVIVDQKYETDKDINGDKFINALDYSIIVQWIGFEI